MDAREVFQQVVLFIVAIFLILVSGGVGYLFGIDAENDRCGAALDRAYGIPSSHFYAPEPATPWESQMVEVAIRECENARRPDPFLMLQLLRLETHPQMRVPERFRGVSLSAACNESGFNPGALGDRYKGKPRAYGLYQLWPIHRKACNLSRAEALDPIANAKCWLSRIHKTHRKLKRLGSCRKANSWTAAHSWVAVGNPLKCKRVSRGHVRRLARWKKKYSL